MFVTLRRRAGRLRFLRRLLAISHVVTSLARRTAAAAEAAHFAANGAIHSAAPHHWGGAGTGTVAQRKVGAGGVARRLSGFWARTATLGGLTHPDRQTTVASDFGFVTQALIRSRAAADHWTRWVVLGRAALTGGAALGTRTGARQITTHTVAAVTARTFLGLRAGGAEWRARAGLAARVGIGTSHPGFTGFTWCPRVSSSTGDRLLASIATPSPRPDPDAPPAARPAPPPPDSSPAAPASVGGTGHVRVSTQE